MSQPTPEVQISENELIALRQQKLADIRTKAKRSRTIFVVNIMLKICKPNLPITAKKN
jgi:hypothetical protein